MLATRAVSESLSMTSLCRFPVIVAVASSVGPFEIQHRFETNDVVKPDLSKVGTDNSW